MNVLMRLFLTGRVVRKPGVAATIALRPGFSIIGFAAVAAMPELSSVVPFQMLRRAGNFAITRPTREVLFTVCGCAAPCGSVGGKSGWRRKPLGPGHNMTISAGGIMDNERQQGRRHALALLGSAMGMALTAPEGSAQPTASPQAPSRVFVTGSSDGLGLEAARQLIALGHHVILHGRNRKRADDAMAAAPGAVAAVVGDASVVAETRALADQVNKIGPCDAVIHNVGIGGRSGAELTPDGLSPIFAVNTLAPFILTALIGKPRRLVYLSSSASRGVRLDPADLTLAKRDGWSAYGASKLQDVLLAFAVARRWPGVLSNAMDPGWVPTRMGGAGAPDSMAEGAETGVWLAASNDAAAKVTGRFFFHKKEQAPNPEANDRALQDRLMAECERISGVRLPG